MKKFLLILLVTCLACSNDDENETLFEESDQNPPVYSPLEVNENVSEYNKRAFFEGFTLFTPTVSNATYLINMEGYPVKKWTSQHKGLVAYLDGNGNLFRVFDTFNQNFNAGGSMGGIEMFDFEGNLLWQWTLSTELEVLHHDIALLPNGNILASVWEKKNLNEAIEAGRNPAKLTENEVWPDKVIEIKILPNNQAEIVWEWSIWDHLIQDYDPTKMNYGNIQEHSELADINFTLGVANFNHINSIHYIEQYDQIILSSRKFNELWILDHSTTTTEAKTHSGGNYGKGGDLLFRYGNPISYKNGEENNQTLFDQHDVTWIGNKENHGGNFLVFNNAFATTMSSIDEISIPQNPNGSYFEINSTPVNINWSYQNPNLFSPRVSGARRLENGNTLITQGRGGILYEIDANKNIVWKYEIPLPENQTFKAFRYSKNYSAFNNKNLIRNDSIIIE